jgi:hypothetical protein
VGWLAPERENKRRAAWLCSRETPPFQLPIVHRADDLDVYFGFQCLHDWTASAIPFRRKGELLSRSAGGGS